MERLSTLQHRKHLELASNTQDVEKANQLVLELQTRRTLSRLQNAAARVIVREFRKYMRYKKDLNIAKAKGKRVRKSAIEK